MKKLSITALAAALAVLSTAAVAAPPAAAQKKEEKKAPKVSDAFRNAGIAAQKALDAKDWAGADPLVAAAEGAAASDYEKFVAAGYRLRLESGRNSSEGMAKALDALIASPVTEPGDQARYNFYRGQIAYDAKQHAVAVPYLQKARELNYNDANLNIMLVNSYMGSGNLNAGTALLDNMIKAEEAAGRKAPDAWYAYAVSELYKAKNPAVMEWVRRELAAHPTPANWRKLLLLYRDGKALGKMEKLDLFRLQQAIGAMNSETEYFDYANATSEAGLPWETQRVIAEARSTGAIKGAGTSFARLEELAKTRLASEIPLSQLEKLAQSEANGKRASQTADAYLAAGDYAKAVSLYQLALQKGGVDTDEVNNHLGVALAKAGRKEEAKQAFAKVKVAPYSDIAAFWTMWLESGTAPATAAN